MENYKVLEKQRSQLFSNVFAWMFSGVIVSFITGVLINIFRFDTIILGSNISVIGILLGQIAICLLFSFGLKRFSLNTLRSLFVVYSASFGLTFSVVARVYTGTSILSALCGAAGMFILLAVYGFCTKKDVSKWPLILFCALIASSVASLVNIFLLRSALFETLINVGVIILFSFFTIYDINNMKKQLERSDDSSTIQKLQIYFAFNLYLDFVVLFLRLLRLFGSKND